MKTHSHALTTAALVAAMLLALAPVPATAGPATSTDGPAAASITLAKTVGTDFASCATTSEITFPPGGGTAVYCFTVTNTGDVTFTHHSLYDDRIGGILSLLPYNLGIGASAFLTVAVPITQTTVNTAQWTAILDTLQIMASDTATVTVAGASISLVKTVGTTPGVCAATTEISVETGTTVYYCYTVTNTGDVALGFHSLIDNKLGDIFSNINNVLGPGNSLTSIAAGYTATAEITQTTVNTATWYAYSIDVASAEAGAEARVNVLPAAIVMTKTVGLVQDVCAATDQLAVVAGTTVYYCYTVTNTGDVAFNLHDLVDDKLGPVFSGLNFSLAPGVTINSVAPGYVVPSITGTTLVNTAVWTAYNVGGASASARDAATLTVQSATSVDVIGFDVAAVSGAKCGNASGAECARLTWRTSSEAGVAGYRVLRAAAVAGGEPDRVAATAVSPLVQSAGDEGASYDWLDVNTAADTIYGYWLQRLDSAGNASELGPAIIRVRGDVIDLPDPARVGR